MAVGGYGRGEMALHSDVDIAFVTPWKATGWTEKVIEAILYLLWDLGLKVGHSHPQRRRGDPRRRRPTIRSAPRSSRRATSGATRRSTTRSRRASGRRSSPATSRAFVKEKLDERDARHKRMGDSRYVVEPNVKEGKGGLRDLHALFWIGKYAYRLRAVAELVEVGLLSRRRAAPVPARRALPLGGALPPPPRRRPRRGAADLRLSARDRGADELCRPARQIAGRALHAPLFPAREDGRRPDRRLPRPSRREVRAARPPHRPARLPPPAGQARRLHARPRPARHPRRRFPRRGSGAAGPDVRARRPPRPRNPPAGDARRRARRQADRRQGARRSARQRAVPRRADLPARSRRRCCAG